MKIISEQGNDKVVDFEEIINSEIYNFVKNLDYVEFVNKMDYNLTDTSDLNTYLKLNFRNEDFKRLQSDFAEFLNKYKNKCL